MTKISEQEFAGICREIRKDGERIFRHNPIGTREETLLWMLLGVLISYLNLSELETPCFAGATTKETYRTAILHILQAKMETKFTAEKYVDELIEARKYKP